MKSLARLRLINWHFFANTNVPIQNISFLTGDNGTGKSTVIDALQVVILGSTMSSNFNKAAHEEGKSGRDIMSYLRGSTGTNLNGEVINLRTGVFTSYIAIELYDTETKKTITLGILFDVDSSDAPDKHFFYLNSKFPENDFSTPKNNSGKSRPLNYKEFSSYLASNYAKEDYCFFATDTEYKLFSKEIFGNLSDNYFSLFKQAVAFKPVTDITKFITEYVWDGAVKINIGHMQANIEQYKTLQIEANTLSKKKDRLEEISNLYQNYTKSVKQMSLINYLNNRVYYEQRNNKILSLKKQVENSKNELVEIANRINSIDESIRNLNTDMNTCQAKIYQGSNYSEAEKIILEKDNLTSNIASIQLSIENVKNDLNEYFSKYNDACYHFFYYYDNFDIRKFNNSRIENSFKEILDLTHDIVDDTNALRTNFNENKIDYQSLSLFRNNIEILNNKIVSFRSTISDKVFELSSKVTSLQRDVTDVSSGKKPFEKLGPAYIAIKNELESTLKNRHDDAKVEIFCDLIDIIDPEWQMSIEAVLFNQKFNFFVNPQYYEEAHKILKELSNTYNYTNVSLVDTERLLKANITPYDDSIAMLVESSREDAQAYADYLLGKITKCETFAQARDSGNGLLKDCTGYRNFGSWYLNKDRARYFYIGTKVDASTVSNSTNDLKETTTLSNLYNELLEKLNNLALLPVISEKELQSYQNVFSKSTDIDSMQSRINNLQDEMQKIGKGEFATSQTRIAQIKKEIDELSLEKDHLNEKKGEIQNKISYTESVEIPNYYEQAKIYKDELDKVDEDLVNNEYEPFYNSLVENQSASQILTKIQSEIMKAENDEKAFKNRLLIKRRDYIKDYNLNYDTEKLSSNEEFDKELESISSVKLPEYKEKIAIAYAQSIKEFKDDFIYKLRTSIEAVTARIEEINGILSTKQFGRDKYVFSISRNKTYREYYDMIMDELLLKTGDAETLFMEKYSDKMKEIFDEISSSTVDATPERKEEILRNIDLFTSYTTYVDFDLQVKRNIGGKEETISLGKSIRSQSGGETQNPIYVAIFACFASIVRANNESDNNTLRLVIFDEAFSKMDSDRIKNTVDLLREFGLQAIISTPGEKLNDFINYVDLILLSINDVKRRVSDLDIYAFKGRLNESFSQPVDQIPSESNLLKETNVDSINNESKSEQEIVEETNKDE